MASCIESAWYSCFTVVSLPTVLNLDFSEKSRRNVNPSKFLDLIKGNSKATILENTLSKIIKSDIYKIVCDFRNTMTHRSNIPRIITIGSTISNPKPLHFGKTWSTTGLEEDEKYLEEINIWLSMSLKETIKAGSSYI